MRRQDIEKDSLATLPTEALGEEERREVNRRVRDMKRGDYVELDEAR